MEQMDPAESTASEATVYKLSACHLAEKIPVKRIVERYFASLLEQSTGEAIFRFGPDSYLLVYSFGVAAFFNLSAGQQQEIAQALREICSSSAGALMTDDFLVVVDERARERVQFDRATLHDLSLPKIQILALVVAHSVTLDYYEGVVEALLDQSEAITTPMKETGRLPRYTRATIKYIGISLSTRRDLISWLYIMDAPDVVWEDSGLDRLFKQMKAMLDIDVRYRALEYKLKLIQEGVEVIVDLTNAHRNILLEITIVVLIVVEILLALHVVH